ncbi:Uncharacterized protein DAT39_005731 [Clarias magur]|uniref:Uncharacterized protein n=1 Tax=Clarias magur TaxID=1594786 RepID=A0A8J4TVH1_CLAMG|nr:Uncharacterized protein DAT39_005731 [Clarias magur]
MKVLIKLLSLHSTTQRHVFNTFHHLNIPKVTTHKHLDKQATIQRVRKLVYDVICLLGITALAVSIQNNFRLFITRKEFMAGGHSLM